MSINFRQRARDCLARASLEIDSNDPERLKYAALELRMAIESLTYERARGYKSEMAPSAYQTWQPKRLMQELLEIEPYADQSSSISFGREDTPGEHAKEMTVVGAEKVFDLRAIKANYDALGSFLHTPTLHQLENGGANVSRLRDRCIALVADLQKVLASDVFNINFGVFTSIQCLNTECGKTVRKRHPHGKQKLSAECHECGAPYEVTAGDDGRWVWRSLVEDIPCPTESCTRISKIWPNDLKPGAHWTCAECNQYFKIGLAIFSDLVTEESSSNDES